MSSPPRLLCAEIINAVRQAGAAGIFMADIARAFEGRTASSKNVVGNALSRAAADGTLAWVLEPGPKSPWRRRYFALEFAPAVNGPATLPPPAALKRTAQALGAPDGPAVVPENVRITVLPSAPVYSRHQLPPGERVVGGFASMGVGRYLDGRA